MRDLDSQQQSATTPTFRYFGASNTGTSLLGAFGQTMAASPSMSAFGASHPATGFGAFGGDEGVLSTAAPTAETSTTNVSGLFTPPKMRSPSAGSSPFWRSDPTTGFGVAPTTGADGTAPLTPYAAFLEEDPSNPSVILQYLCITTMPAYRALSIEELRLQDYERSGYISASRHLKRQRSGMLDPRRQERLEAILRESLIEDVADSVRFHLFSARSSSSSRFMKPRVLRTNKTFLSESSKYFADLLSAAIPSDSSWVIVSDDSDVPSNARIDDYGYESDSDLEDSNDPDVAILDAEEQQPTTSPNINAETRPKDDGSSEYGAGSAGSSEFIVTPKQPRAVDQFPAGKDGASSVSSGEPVVQKSVEDVGSGRQAGTRPRSLGGCNVLVKDAAFQTWYSLLNYLYTNKVYFLPLTSAALAPGGHPKSSASPRDEPRCSAKSMYRLASKVGLGHLCDEALSHIRSQLTEHNILREISCSLVQTHPELLEMELDVLHSLTASPPVIANFPTFAQRIANNELPHGANIIIGMHTRFLNQLYPFRNVTRAASLSSSSCSLEPRVKVPASIQSKERKGRGKKKSTGKQTPPSSPRESVRSSSVSPTSWIKSEDKEGSVSQGASNAFSSESPKSA